MAEQTIQCIISEQDIITVEICDSSTQVIQNLTSQIAASIILEDLTTQIDGANIDFVVSQKYLSGNIKVFVNGLKERFITELTNTIVRLSPAPQDGDSVEVEYIRDVN